MRPRTQLAWGVFAVLMAVYLLVFCGAANTDDEQLFAALTANLAERGSFSALQMFGNDRIRGGTGGLEPMHMLLGVPVYALASFAGLGKVQALYILPAFFTALSAALLTAIAARRGYSPPTAVLAGLAYGLGTIAFPYARTNFREPLAALWITGALFCLEIMRENPENTGRVLASSLVMLDCLVGAALTKVTSLVCLPFFLLVSWICLQGSRTQRVCLAALGVTLIFYTGIGFMVISQGLLPSLSRFTPDFAGRMLLEMARLPHQNFLSALLGMLFSPGKGLLVYSPVLLLAGFSLAQIRKESREHSDAILGIGCLLGLAAVQALAYDSDWWGITWGTRALLPALPLLVLLCLPALAQGLQHPDRSVRWLMMVCVGISLLVQAGRLLVPDPTYAVWLIRHTGQPVSAADQWRLGFMPLWRHWALFFEGYRPDIAWLQVESVPAWLVGLALFAILALLAVGIRMLTRAGGVSSLLPGVAGLAICLAVPLTLAMARYDGRYYWSDESFQQANAVLCNKGEAGDLVLVDAYLKPAWSFMANFGCRKLDMLGLPYEHGTADRSSVIYPRLYELEEVIRQRQAEGQSVYLLETTNEEWLPYHVELAGWDFKAEPVSPLLEPTQSAQLFKIY